jgi:hypothetical protein
VLADQAALQPFEHIVDYQGNGEGDDRALVRLKQVAEDARRGTPPTPRFPRPCEGLPAPSGSISQRGPRCTASRSSPPHRRPWRCNWAINGHAQYVIAIDDVGPRRTIRRTTAPTKVVAERHGMAMSLPGTGPPFGSGDFVLGLAYRYGDRGGSLGKEAACSCHPPGQLASTVELCLNTASIRLFASPFGHCPTVFVAGLARSTL